MLKFDKSLVIYRPELRKITGSINSAILLNQMIYWFYNKKGDGEKFYKFREPCKHEKYSDGDSWTEELGFSKAEFNTAIKKIGYKNNDSHNKIKEEEALIWFHRKADGLTYYEINEELLEEKLNELYRLSTVKKPTTNTNTQDKEETAKKLTYSDEFEVAWQTYNKKTSNKKKSMEYFKSKIIKFHSLDDVLLAIKEYKKLTDIEFMKNFEGFLNGMIESYIPRKCWVIDSNDIKWDGDYYDFSNKFKAINGRLLTLKSELLAQYIVDGRFGYH